MANIDLKEKPGLENFRRRAGRPAGKNYKCITLTLSEEAVIRLKEMAQKKDMTISQFITDHFDLPYYKELPSSKGKKGTDKNSDKKTGYKDSISRPLLIAEEEKPYEK